MKSFSLPIILVLAIETAVWINFSIAYFTDSTVFYLAYLIISSVQLGATVDYAILLTDRYLEYRKVRTKKESVIQSVSTCTGSVLVSGSVMTVVGLLLGKVSTNQLLSQIGYFLGKGAMLSLTIVLFVLPGLLYICDGIIVRTTNLGKKKKDILSQSGMREKYESIS
jgi:predicted RND superfamily exporter protein